MCNSFLKTGDLLKETLNTVMLDVSYRDVFSDVVIIEKCLTDVEEAYLRPHAIIQYISLHLYRTDLYKVSTSTRDFLKFNGTISMCHYTRLFHTIHVMSLQISFCTSSIYTVISYLLLPSCCCFNYCTPKRVQKLCRSILET